jgi:hypothetical protein
MTRVWPPAPETPPELAVPPVGTGIGLASAAPAKHQQTANSNAMLKNDTTVFFFMRYPRLHKDGDIRGPRA